MTRLFTDGGETGDLTAIDGGTNPTIDNTVYRSGAYSYRTANGGTIIKYLPSDITEVYVRCGLHVTADAGTSFIRIYSNLSTLECGVIRSGVNQTLSVVRGSSTTLATGTKRILSNQWYLLEIYYLIHDTTGRFIVKIDGVIDIDFTGDTKQTNSNFDTIYWGNTTGNYSYFDDLAINDANGAVDNSWCGDGKIVALVPNGDSSVQWLGSDGDTTNNYALIDEIPPSDSDYVRATGSGYTDIYTLSNVDFAGQTIQRIWMVSRSKSDTIGDYFLHGIQVSGSNYLVTGSLGTSFGRTDIQATGTWALNPYTGSEWSQEQLDNLLLVIKAPG